MSVAADVALVASDVAHRLQEGWSVRSVAWVGSWARATASPGSDVDVVAYRDHGEQCASLAGLVSDLHVGSRKPVVTPCCWAGQWGQAFASFDRAGVKVDLTVRDVGDVEGRVGALVSGLVELRCTPGAPYPSPDLEVAGELAHGQALSDREGWWASLRDTLVPMPEAMRTGLVERLTLECTSLLRSAAAGAARGSALEAVASSTAAVAHALTLVQVRNAAIPASRRLDRDGVAACPDGRTVIRVSEALLTHLGDDDVTGAVADLRAALSPVLWPRRAAPPPAGR